ncbi:AarF/ABC1/UbiB kinase family protein [Rhodococcus ruber]|uniref:Putative unusual protein kinase n=1 Tax=Rhodococcus ruber TaxID=1830 RepID=A0A098BPJ5_9NOCA|nr:MULTISPECIES: AarF/ABC1/UbiB kinase family protein [Rhodococcus]AUM19316.1 ABC transporter [Rhodococcus ruber]AXY49791.1 ABC1 family protein [Rhodococcus ruber]MBD8054846.1 AarF/ABC1/UbiB kinase family protein [Rhodococcus ruber]MCF8784565.1 AarF/ABC1/UbiB kinase family protein [Rhodococcus ruber]MCZ1074634.1 AarF/ABC1/UbiB kinase family protein [Rhodococcus sp. A5(2022)]
MSHAERYRQIAETFARHGFGFLIGVAGLQRWLPLHRGLLGHARRDQPYSNPEHLRLALEQLGPTFVKLGQVLSTRPDLLPEPYRRELAVLQDAAPPVPGPLITSLVTHDLGAAPSEVFASFDLQPLASASLGQAHAATLADGTEVVVKVRRPNVVEQIEQDLEILHNLAARAQRRWEAAADYDLVGIAEEFARTLRAELDYLHEGRNAERFAANFASSATIRIPRIYWDTTTSRVLTIERIRGIKIDDVQALDAAGIDRSTLAHHAAWVAAKMVFEDGFFHADPHPGNFFIEPGGRIGLIDFGMVGEVDAQLREKLGALLIALAGQQPRRVAAALTGLSSGRGRVDVPALATDLAPLLDRYAGRELGQISLGALIQDVLTVVRRHHVQIPSDLALLSKMLIMVEGLGVELDPQFQLAELLDPYARRLASARYSPEVLASRFRQAGFDVLDVVAELPDQLRRLRETLDAGGPEVHLRAAELEPFVARLETTGRRLVVALVAAALVRTLGAVMSAEAIRNRFSGPSPGSDPRGSRGADGLRTGRTRRRRHR